MLLIVYVDDMKLAGPKEEMEKTYDDAAEVLAQLENEAVRSDNNKRGRRSFSSQEKKAARTATATATTTTTTTTSWWTTSRTTGPVAMRASSSLTTIMSQIRSSIPIVRSLPPSCPLQRRRTSLGLETTITAELLQQDTTTAALALPLPTWISSASMASPIEIAVLI